MSDTSVLFADSDDLHWAMEFVAHKSRPHLDFLFRDKVCGGPSDSKKTLLVRIKDYLRNNPDVLAYIVACPDEVDNYIRTNFKDRDRIREARRTAAAVNTSLSEEHQSYQYCDTPSFDILVDRLTAYSSRTGVSSLSKIVCASCGMSSPAGQSINCAAREIPSPSLLRPDTMHTSHYVYQGMVLHPDGVDEFNGTVTLCSPCNLSLTKGARPFLALASGTWPGPIPPEISALTFVERILIAPIIVRSYLVKLYPKHVGAKHLPPEQLNDAIRGNICSVCMPVDDIKHMLEGDLSNVLPHPARVLADAISVAFIGLGSIPPYFLRGFLTVRRSVVHDALLWLKHNNPEFSNININQSNLSSLPENAVPVEIDIRSDADPRLENLARSEGRGYEPDKETTYEDENAMEIDPAEKQSSGGVIPDFSLESVELIDMDSLETIPDTTNLLRELFDVQDHDLRNTVNHSETEHKYGIKIGTQFANEYDPRTYLLAFPHLFPYGIGAPCSQHGVTLKQYFHWSMRFADRRFRLDKQFLFMLFGVQQKRDVSRSARLTFNRRDWNRISSAMSKVSDADIRRAIKEEEANMPISNRAIADFIRTASATRSHAVGSDAARYAFRSEIWGTCVMFGNPSLWLTINLTDHHDPIAMFLLGEDINLDDFNHLVGPSADERSRLIREDPYTAAEYFHIIITAILEELIGVTVEKNRVRSRLGVLGLISSYYGVVESQGRGNLHVHLLLWIANTPDASRMKELLQSESFRHRVETYIRQTIHAHAEGVTEDNCTGPNPQPHPSYSRPPNPSSPSFLADLAEAEKSHVESSQYHSCSTSCLKKKKGKEYCKRHAPFKTSNEVTLDSSGNYTLLRLIDRINSYNPWIHSFATRSNGDCTFITFGSDTKDLIWYITAYATKSQGKTYNASALLAKMKKYSDSGVRLTPYEQDVQRSCKELLTKFANAMNSRQEISACMAAASMENWAPVYTPHLFKKIFLADILRVYHSYLKKGFNPLSLRPSTELSEENEHDEIEHNVSLEIVNGVLVEKSQLNDYVFRGECFNDKCLLDFCLDTFEDRLTVRNADILAMQGEDNARRNNIRARYREPHPAASTRIRIAHNTAHRYLPAFVGASFPSATNPDEASLYYACMQLLFRPWTSWDDVLRWGQDWSASFNQFFDDAPQRIRSLIHNTQLQRESRAAADSKQSTEATPSGDATDVMDNDEEDIADISDSNINDDFLDDGHIIMDENGTFNLVPEPWAPGTKQSLYCDGACAAGEGSGVLPPDDESRSWLSNDVSVPFDVDKLTQWISTLDNVESVSVRNFADPSCHEIPSSVFPIVDDRIDSSNSTSSQAAATSLSVRDLEARVRSLNTNQRLAYDIVYHHLDLSRRERAPEQLLMKCFGAPGTGKSHVIDTLTLLFKSLMVSLAKSAHQGSAASNIGGSTLCSLCEIRIFAKNKTDGSNSIKAKLSGEDIRALKVKFQNIDYLIIDEISQVGCAMLARISRHLGSAKSNPTLCFGGINTILFGDFHQIGPIGDQILCSTSVKSGSKLATTDVVTGQQIYQAFTVAVELTEQVRVKDPVWQSFLSRMRYGNINEDDLKLLRNITLKQTWSKTDPLPVSALDSILLTPRRLVRDKWNARLVRDFAMRQNACLYRCPADDTIGGQPLNMMQLASVQALDPDKRGKMPDLVEFCVGMPCMVTQNVYTSVGVANGARGCVVGVCLDPKEHPPAPGESIVTLRHQPAYVLFKPDRPNGVSLPGLEENVIPIQPRISRDSFKIYVRGKALNVVRRQTGIIAAFAMTMHKSQGQNIRYVIVDGLPPPSGSVDPSMYYVAFSRSPGRDNIRLLRHVPDKVWRNVVQHFPQNIRDDDKLLWNQAADTLIKFRNGELFKCFK